MTRLSYNLANAQLNLIHRRANMIFYQFHRRLWQLEQQTAELGPKRPNMARAKSEKKECKYVSKEEKKKNEIRKKQQAKKQKKLAAELKKKKKEAAATKLQQKKTERKV